MPKTKEQINEIKKQRKELILHTALELFASQGYHATSIDQIAQKAGISKGLIYNYFQSKQSILDSVVESLFIQIDSLLHNKDPENLTEKDIIQIVYQTIDMIKNDTKIFKLYFMLYFQPDIEKLVKPLSIDYINKLINFLTPFFRKKGVKNTKPIILSFISALDGLTMHFLFFQYKEIDEMATILINKYIKQ